MARRIFEDNDGLYFRAYDKNRRLVKVYCDEEGTPIKGKRVVPIEIEEEEEELVAAAGGGFSLKKFMPLLISLFLAALVIFVGFFAYNKFANANPKVDITSGYDVSFAPTGHNGEAKAGIKVNKIPTVSNVTDETQKKAIEDILNNPRVSYSKTEGLRNGDNVEVTVVLDETKVKANNLEVVGTYKKSFKVEGLGEKPAVVGINPNDGSNNDASTTSDQNSSASVVASTRAPRAAAATPAATAAPAARGTQSAAVPSGTIAVPRTVNPAAANVRSGAGTNTAIAGTVSQGRQVTEVRRVQNAKGETWSQVQYGNGRTGWIRSNLLS